MQPISSLRMSIWKQHGEKKLRELLALMGIPLVQSRQLYTAMNLELKQLLHEVGVLAFVSLYLLPQS